MRNRTFALVTLLLLATSVAILSGPAGIGSAYAAVKSDHPRIWLTPELKGELVDRLGRNTANAVALRDWCDTHLNDDLGNYVDSRGVTALKAINHALMYQLTGDERYGNRAIEIVLYILDHPYSGYSTDSWIEFDNFYTDRYLVPTVAIVYDWCYPLLADDVRQRISGQLDRWATRIINSEPWSFYDPSNNYYYGHMWALLTTGYAIYGDNSNATTYINYARDVMLAEGIKYTRGEEIAWETMGNRIGRAKGGLWNEGTSYGCVNNEFICSAVQAVKSAEGIEYPEFTFPGEVVKFYIYATYPQGDHTYADGDGAVWGTLDATVRVPILLASSLADDETKRFAQFFLSRHTSYCRRDYKLYNEFIWYDDTLPESDYRGLIPDTYLAEGSQVLFWREGWSESDCWMAFRIGVLNTDHAHNGLGNFIIYKNGYLATDKAAELQESMWYSDIHHNVLYIPPAEDKKLYWGASKIEHLESTSEYLYFAGDMTDVYTAQPDYRNNTVAHKEREFFLLKQEKLLFIMDRGESFDPGVDKVFQIYLHNAAIQDGTFYRTSNGSNDLLIRTAYPGSAVVTLDEYGMPRFRVTTPDLAPGKTFLHVLKVVDPGENLYTADVSVDGADVAATLVRSVQQQLDYLAAFSNDINGDPQGAQSYSLTFDRFNNRVKIFIMNNEPNATYYISYSSQGSRTMVALSRTSQDGSYLVTSNSEGIILADINLSGEEQPVAPPSGVRID